MYVLRAIATTQVGQRSKGPSGFSLPKNCLSRKKQKTNNKVEKYKYTENLVVKMIVDEIAE